MRVSILIAAHNEREALLNTVRACRERSAGVDCEIVVGDDASADGSAAALAKEFPSVHVARHEQRQGVSPTRQLAARQAQGEAFLFLDAHCNPEPGAIARLVDDVRETGGDALITPKIPALDVARWENTAQQIGHGYRLELERFDCGWLPLEQLQRVREGAREFYESPAMIGCALAVSRKLYEKLWGFDADMRMWGVEDLDFSLKCWLAGHRILHDPEAVVGHRFRTTFDNFDAPIEHFLVNQLRMAYKNFTEGVWIEWVDRTLSRHCQQLSEHPEGLWARVWLMFNETRASADAERAHLSAQQVHDELWYADRCGLNWPRLAPLPGESASGGFRSPRRHRSRDDAPDGPSPSPPPPRNPKVSIKKGSDDITDKTTTVVVGQHIILDGAVEGSGFKVSAMRWDISGDSSTRISECDPQSGYMSLPAPLSDDDLKSSEVSFYWIDDPGGDVTVTFSVKVDGSDYSANAKFNVLRPTASFTSQTTTANPPVSVGPSPTDLSIPCSLNYGAVGNPGITFTGQVTAPQGGEGQIAITQAINTCRRWRDNAGVVSTRSSNGNYISDNKENTNDGAGYVKDESLWPIGDDATETTTSEDCPAFALDQNHNWAYAYDQFKTYLVYRPKGDDSIWVTLSVIEWSWGGSASRGAVTAVNPYGWFLYSTTPPVINPPGAPCAVTPKWVNWFTNLEFIPDK